MNTAKDPNSPKNLDSPSAADVARPARTRRTPRAAAVALATAAALIGTAGLASADGGNPAPKSTPTSDGAHALCKRVPKIDKRLTRALKRLDGKVTRRGSIARLEKRVENAKAAGHKEIEAFLNDRLTFRRSLVQTLEKRQKDLVAVKTWCRDNDNGKAN